MYLNILLFYCIIVLLCYREVLWKIIFLIFVLIKGITQQFKILLVMGNILSGYEILVTINLLSYYRDCLDSHTSWKTCARPHSQNMTKNALSFAIWTDSEFNVVWILIVIVLVLDYKNLTTHVLDWSNRQHSYDRRINNWFLSSFPRYSNWWGLNIWE